VTTPDMAIVGGGLLGRCLAWRASRAGANVAIYDASGPAGEGSAAWAAAGMVAPTAEASDTNAQIVAMGRHSLTLWPRWLAELPVPVFYRDTGTLLLWHQEDASEALRCERMLAARYALGQVQRVGRAQMEELEPALRSKFQEALYLASDAQVDNRALLRAVAVALEESNVDCHWHTVVSESTLPSAKVIVDCRGMGARRDWPGLRGVRGEIVRLRAPEVELSHMLRLLHPRLAVYIVPRAEGMLVVGATTVEGDDYSPVSVRGALELLSSAYSVLPGLAEARILELATQVRPALPDNLPALHYDHGQNVLRINGLYRHGFLLTPVVVEEALSLLSVRGQINLPGRWPCLRERRPDMHHIGSREETSLCSSS
jgi:glycine oxidase